MAQTTILSSIQRSQTFPITKSIQAPNNCGTLSLILDQSWTEQMIHELPTINVAVFVDTDIKLLSIDIDMTTFCSDRIDIEPVKPYSIPLFDLPEYFDFVVTPIFDNNALSAHNAQIDSGDIDVFNTSDTGIVDTDIKDYYNDFWDTPTSTFIVKIVFDNSNISSGGGGGGGGGGGTPTASDVSYDGSSSGISATNVQDAIDELDQTIEELPEPMIFKGSLGTGGTISTLPTASSDNKGYTYKVITAGTYAGQTADIGDTFISDGTAWVLIPSGDEPSGTVTNVAVTSTDGSATITGSPITSSGTIDISVVTDSALNANSTKPVQNALLSRLFTPLTQDEYDALTNKDLPLYFIYD